MKTILTLIAVLFVGCEENEKWLTKEEGYWLTAFLVVAWIFWEIIKLTGRISKLESELEYERKIRREESGVLREKVERLDRTPEEQEEWENEQRKIEEQVKKELEKTYHSALSSWPPEQTIKDDELRRLTVGCYQLGDEKCKIIFLNSGIVEVRQTDNDSNVKSVFILGYLIFLKVTPP